MMGRRIPQSVRNGAREAARDNERGDAGPRAGTGRRLDAE